MDWPFLRVFEFVDHEGGALPNVVVRVSWMDPIAPDHALHVEGTTDEGGRVVLPLPSTINTTQSRSSTPGFNRTDEQPPLTPANP